MCICFRNLLCDSLIHWLPGNFYLFNTFSEIPESLVVEAKETVLGVSHPQPTSIGAKKGNRLR